MSGSHIFEWFAKKSKSNIWRSITGPSDETVGFIVTRSYRFCEQLPMEFPCSMICVKAAPLLQAVVYTYVFTFKTLLLWHLCFIGHIAEIFWGSVLMYINVQKSMDIAKRD